jgi:2-hydroxy-3-keto-5-methylthiopentenyl-1-phosphate phosphatase
MWPMAVNDARLTRMPAPVVVLDFDGTITMADMAYLLCKHFVGDARQPAVERWLRKEISLPQAQQLIWPLIRAPEAEVMAYVAETAVLREGFDRLLARCRELAIPVMIASGGFDFYVRAILGETRLAQLETVICNRAVFTSNGISVEFPHADLSCDQCAVCKGLVLDRLRAQGLRPIFAGDGFSDRCAVGRADRLFTVAERELHSLCQRQGASHHPFTSFDEITALLDAP